MPNELFAQVLSCLDDTSGSIYTLLSLTYVSKTINAKTKKANGTTIVDARAMSVRLGPKGTPFPKKLRYVEANVALENKGFPRRKLARLTCSDCGVRKSNSMDGFVDGEFKKGREHRRCIRCMTISSGKTMKLHGCWVFRCVDCQEYGLNYASNGERC